MTPLAVDFSDSSSASWKLAIQWEPCQGEKQWALVSATAIKGPHPAAELKLPTQTIYGSESTLRFGLVVLYFWATLSSKPPPAHRKIVDSLSNPTRPRSFEKLAVLCTVFPDSGVDKHTLLTDSQSFPHEDFWHRP
jgi:hypothetical protein